MSPADTRHLMQHERERLRRRGLALIRRGRSQASVAAAMGVRPATVSAWVAWSRHGGRARQVRSGIRLVDASQLALVRRELQRSTGPRLWTPERLADLLAGRVGRRPSRWTVASCLGRLGLPPARTLLTTVRNRAGAALAPLVAEANRAGAALWFAAACQLRDGGWVLAACNGRGELKFSLHATRPKAQDAADLAVALHERVRRPVRLVGAGRRDGVLLVGRDGRIARRPLPAPAGADAPAPHG